jgi:hypothetical protein
MSKSIVAVSDSTDPNMIEYVQKQLEAIAISFPDVAIEHVNENDSIMERYARYPGRVPAFFILKNGARMAVLQAKINTPELIVWVSENLG